jgi:hypothetical protein
MDEGIQLDWRAWQHENTSWSRTEILQLGSKVTFVSFLQPPKQPQPIVSVDEGMQMDWSAQQDANASLSRTEILQLGSKVTFASFSQPPKQ